ncbi:MAG TPA: hypothetical protein VGI04_03965 [Neobacillus sp.]|jgi:hypothetical protein
MKFFRGVTNCFSRFFLLLGLLVGLILANSQSAMAETENVIGSAESNGITLTINNYTIKNYGQEMTVYYTLQSTSGQLMDENGAELITSPDFTIGDKRVQGNDIWHKKISAQKYQGALKLELPQYRPAISNAVLNTETILNQKGQWSINFQIKK